MTDRKKSIAFTQLPDNIQKKTQKWIKENLRPAPWINRYVSTYGLLDVLDAETGLALSAGQLNEALISAGYKPKKTSLKQDLAGLGWNWNISLSAPYFRKSFRSS